MTASGGAGTPRHQAQQQLPRVRRAGFSHRVGALWSTWLRPFALHHSDAARPACADFYGTGDGLLRPPFPLRTLIVPLLGSCLSTCLLASGCALRTLQRTLTTFKD